MAKQKRSPPKGLREIDNIPPLPENIEFGVREVQKILDVDLPVGAYRLDQVVLDMLVAGKIFQQTTPEQIVRHARISADLAGAYSIEYAHNVLTEPSRRKDAATLLTGLGEMSRAARALKRVKPREVAPVIAQDDDAGDIDCEEERGEESVAIAEGTTEELLAKVADLNVQIEQFLNRYSIDKGTGSSSEPLTHWFILSCALSWHGLTGEWARNNKSDFRRFLVASWGDLKFPCPLNRDGTPKPLEDHFRDRLAKSEVFRWGDGN